VAADESDDADVRARRAAWTNTGAVRPAFAVEPGPGQESVWDYPRPPRVVPEKRPVTVHAGTRCIARSERAVRVLETASPPTVYLPREDVDESVLARASGVSHCEWKGAATYWDVVLDDRRIAQAAWSYEEPYAAFESLRGWIAFYPGRVACRLGDEPVQPQRGGFYGGWVTSDVVGPFKGEPGTAGW
jgi:uncharacterized protein (DUF427 family)